MRLLLVIFVSLLLACSPALGSDDRQTITVSGQASINVEPHYAELRGNLKIVRPTIKESYSAITRIIQELAESLAPTGIGRDQLIASIVQQGTEYQWKNNSRIVSGYYSACSISVKVKDITNTYNIHTILAEFPELTLSATSYGRSDESELRLAALKKALLKARDKATIMAQTLGSELGQVIAIEESFSSPVPIPRYSARMAESVASDPGDVSTIGNISVSGMVTVTFSLL